MKIKIVLLDQHIFLNTVSFVQNIWNSCTSTDYDSYKKFRSEIEKSIKSRNKLLVLEIWKEKLIKNLQRIFESFKLNMFFQKM